jgi:manganese transport protein
VTICGIELPLGASLQGLPISLRRKRDNPGVPWLALAGPAFAISIGYIDPGNWATDIAAGSFGFKLLWVVLVANLMATALQIAVVRLAALTGEDLATTMASRWPKFAPMLWCVFQGAAVATDLAEFSGVVLGLQLLLKWNIIPSVVAGFVAVLAVLILGRHETRRLESIMVLVLGGIALVFAYEVAVLHPSVAAVAGGLVPRIPSIGAIPLIVGIIGATVMPHNLFLHSSLVAKNASGDRKKRIEHARFFSKETWFALGIATFVNGAILVLGGSLAGHNDSIESAFHALLLAEGGLVAVLFGAGLIASGIAAAATATVAGDYVFRALAPWRIAPMARRIATLIPSAALLLWGVRATDLLVWSQIALALVLPAVVVPMLLEYARIHRLHELSLKRPLFVSACAAGGLCIAFDAVLLIQPLVAH